MIKDKYQIISFSGAQNSDWGNEMMWARYGGMHSGVCLEFDEDVLLQNLLTKYPNTSYHLENIDYSNKKGDHGCTGNNINQRQKTWRRS